MGIVNVTPDSFSDGGAYDSADAAAAAAERMLADGATIVDVGGESTRPGADPVDVEEELRRNPVLTVDDSDAGGIDQVADGPATGGEEADIAPDGREDRRDLRRRLLPGAKDRRAP